MAVLSGLLAGMVVSMWGKFVLDRAVIHVPNPSGKIRPSVILTIVSLIFLLIFWRKYPHTVLTYAIIAVPPAIITLLADIESALSPVVRRREK